MNEQTLCPLIHILWGGVIGCSILNPSAHEVSFATDDEPPRRTWTWSMLLVPAFEFERKSTGHAVVPA